MEEEYVKKRNRRQASPSSWWHAVAKTVVGPVLVASLPVAGYAVVSWRDDLRDLDTNFKGLVVDFSRVVEWQGNHARLHRAFDAKYAQARNQEAIVQYQVGECKRDMLQLEGVVEKLSSSVVKFQEMVTERR